ncbi:hypothetical protein EDC04DRAFT_2614630 [Pisolithus marmoratus]|nr:hypothetical protein EDC04DRAFT_2614630 [Pisolithus marmoratus]
MDSFPIPDPQNCDHDIRFCNGSLQSHVSGQFLCEIGPSDPPEVLVDKAEHIEQWLSDAEGKVPVEAFSTMSGYAHLHKYTFKSRNYQTELIALSETYTSHQFGVWADQLGGGRAISIFGTPYPSDPDRSYEVEVKGAGCTPLTWSDSFAVLGSCIASHSLDSGFLENMVSHLVASLDSVVRAIVGIAAKPFTRAFAGSKLQAKDNCRAHLCVLYACIVHSYHPVSLGYTYLLEIPVVTLKHFFQARSFSSVEKRSTPTVVRRILKLANVNLAASDALGKELVVQAARRNVKMVAPWWTYGFMHSVINADTTVGSRAKLGLVPHSVLGPHAFMDVFSPHYVCNNIDQEDQCAYNNIGVLPTEHAPDVQQHWERLLRNYSGGTGAKRLDTGKGTEECHMAHTYAARMEPEKTADPATGTHVRAKVMEIYSSEGICPPVVMSSCSDGVFSVQAEKGSAQTVPPLYEVDYTWPRMPVLEMVS